MLRPVILSISSDFAESISTGKSYLSRSFSTMVMPSITGIITSTMARLIFCCASTSSPSLPLAALCTA